MPTKLSRYAEGVMEAAWLAAIVTAPLFFNKYSSRIFEPDKATLLRSLALIMLLAWCIKIYDQVLVSRKRLSENITIKGLLKVPLVLPVSSLKIAFLSSLLRLGSASGGPTSDCRGCTPPLPTWFYLPR
jgi:hypothetical protein